MTASTGMYNGDRVSVAYAYDGCGSLTNRSWVDADVPAAAFTNAFVYGPDGLATSCTLGTSTVAYVYSAGGVRVKETGPSGTRCFAINPADPFKRVLAELDGSGATVRSYIWAGNRLLCLLDSGGTPRYAHADVQGSVLALTDSAGNVTDQLAYGPYGELYRRTGSTDLPFTWLGGSGVRQLGSGLYATQHRLYDANVKRFIQADPKGIAGGLNLYAYGNLNPLVYVDPLGLCAESGGIRPFPGNDFGLNALLAKDRMRNSNPTRFYEVYGNDRDVQVEMALGLMLDIALMAFDLPAGAGAMRSVRATHVAGSSFRAASAAIGGRRIAGSAYDARKLMQLEHYLSRRNVRLITGADHLLDAKSANGMFNARAGSAELYLRSNPTVYEVKHELSHFIDWRNAGFERYSNVGRVALEQSAYDRLRLSRSWPLFKQAERDSAFEYLYKIGGNPLKVPTPGGL